MAGISLYDYQREALENMHNGCILCGGVGSGKSRTSLAYYYIRNGGKLDTKKYYHMVNPKDLYIITTARKRDTKEWEYEFGPFLIGTEVYSNRVVIDSWNNIAKYKDVTGAFFIFDEQRVVGYGTWAKSFIKIARANEWILLSATPGDTWSDYIPVFIANGFYRNKTEFTRRHCVYSRYTKYPKIERYIDTGRLNALRRRTLVNMKFERSTISHHETLYSSYDIQKYKAAGKDRWNPYTNAPMASASELCYTWRRIVNSDPSRLKLVEKLSESHPKAIIFYNFDYELEMLKSGSYLAGTKIAEWNGHKHEPIPKSDRWLYLVQYTAGCEGWNCIETDTIIFYSQNYSYKVMEQASGRINRLNTPFVDLYYYHLKSHSGIDLAIGKAINEKKNFNESGFIGKW